MEELKMAKIPLLGRFRKKKEISIKPIQVGDVLPEVDIEVTSNGVTEPATITQVLGDGEGIKLLVGMPGAYTPTCSSTHLPGYRNYASKLTSLGVNKIAIVTTNDRFVNDAWAKEMGVIEKMTSTADSKDGSMITIISDGDSDLVKKLGLVEDMGFGVGVRSKRFVLIIEDGVVTHIELDEGLDSCETTSAENIVKILTPPPLEAEESEIDMNLVIGGGAFLLVALFFLLSQGGGDHCQEGPRSDQGNQGDCWWNR
jgi:peroxiredoxin